MRWVVAPCLLTFLFAAQLGWAEEAAVTVLVRQVEQLAGDESAAEATQVVVDAVRSIGRYQVQGPDVSPALGSNGDVLASAGQLRPLGNLVVAAAIGQVGPRRTVSAELVDLSGPRVLSRESADVPAGSAAGPVLAAVVKRLFGLSVQLPEAPPAATDRSARLMVPPVQTTTRTVDLPVTSLTQVAAEAAADLGGFEVVTEDEIRAALGQLRLRYELGCTDEDCLLELGQMVEARYLARVTAGELAGQVVLSSSLIDVDKGRVTQRASLVVPPEQVGDAVRVIVRRSLGAPALLEPVPGAQGALNSRMAGLSGQIAGVVKARSRSSLDRLGQLPFVEIGESVSQRELGTVFSTLLQESLTKGQGVRFVASERLSELSQEMKIDRSDRLSATQLQDIARFLGCSLILRGSVADLGDHFLVQADLVDAASGTPVWSGLSALPRTSGLSELAARALVRRTTAGAVFRSVIGPGWGQFYNGPDHSVKGGIVLAGTLAGIAGTVTGFVLGSMKDAEVKEWDADGDSCLDVRAAKGEEVGVTECLANINRLQGEADDRRLIAFGAAGVAAAFYLWGLIDAAVYAEDYSDVSLSAAVSLGNEPGVLVRVRF